jgi:hypothetical protein
VGWRDLTGLDCRGYGPVSASPFGPHLIGRSADTTYYIYTDAQTMVRTSNFTSLGIASDPGEAHAWSPGSSSVLLQELR